MMATTLISNGASSVYIIGPKQAELDSVAQVYNDAAKTTNLPGRIYGIEGDVRKKSEAVRLAAEVGRREKHVTVLFNNAGIITGSFITPVSNTATAFRKAYFDDVPEAAFDDNMNTNAVGPYWLTFAFLPLLEKWKEGQGGARFPPQVIMTTSMNGWTKDPATSAKSFPYMFSKSALGHATASLAHELSPLGIRVNSIAPGLFITEMSSPGTMDALGQSSLQGRTFEGIEVPVSAPVASGEQRAGTRKDMATLVLFLVANWFVDGETVLIDGGTLLRHPSSY
ncbi:NAD-P-binding protein [Earliella scabrosa]|nr:NAD-P-binding protein [Earliella scabrosa]